MKNVYTFVNDAHDRSFECLFGTGFYSDDIGIVDGGGDAQPTIAHLTVDKDGYVNGYEVDSASPYVAKLEQLYASIIKTKATA